MKSVLVVDDNLVSLKKVSAQLSDSYDVFLAKSGSLALEVCAKKSPDLILLDVEMPGMDGFETIARLKEDPSLQHIPVIFLTGHNDVATEVRCLESGAMDFITKTANSDILRHRVDLHLEFSAYQLHLEQLIKELEDNIAINFAELLNSKDSNAADHVLRSSNYTTLLTQQLLSEGVFGDQLTAEDVELIKRAAPFYDVGKIGVSDIILLKRTPLTDDEYREIQQHTLIGGRVLKAIYDRAPVRFLETAIAIAEGHHECFDGSGYPRGLKGDDIPLCCRIMAVTNTYDACVADRVYRKKASHEEACRIIQEGRGTRFDPRITDVFYKVRDKFAHLTVAPSWNCYHETNTDS